MTSVHAFKTNAPRARALSDAARDFAQDTAGAARVRAAAFHAGAEVATAELALAATESIVATAEIVRDVQRAMHDDARAALTAFENVLSAPSLSDAAKAQMDYLRLQSGANIARAQSYGRFLAMTFELGAKAAQDNFVRLTGKAAS